MPMYEDRCNECNHVTEFLERMDSAGPHVCEKCGSDKMNKIISTFAARNNTPQTNSCPTGTCPLSR